MTILERLKTEEFQLWEIFEEARAISEILDEYNYRITIEPSRQSDGESYIFCSYYSDKLQKTIILDWDFQWNFDDEEELLEVLNEYEEEANEIEGKIIILTSEDKKEIAEGEEIKITLPDENGLDGMTLAINQS